MGFGLQIVQVMRAIRNYNSFHRFSSRNQKSSIEINDHFPIFMGTYPQIISK